MPNNSRGFTLIEVLIAIVVIATGLVLIVEGMARSQEAVGIAKNLVTASRLAEEKLIQLELQSYQGRFLGSATELGKEKNDGRVFEWTKKIGVYADASIIDQSKMNQGEVLVRWKEGPVRKNEMTAVSLFLNREVQSEG